MLGRSPTKYRQRPDLPTAVDRDTKPQINQTNKLLIIRVLLVCLYFEDTFLRIVLQNNNTFCIFCKTNVVLQTFLFHLLAKTLFPGITRLMSDWKIISFLHLFIQGLDRADLYAYQGPGKGFGSVFMYAEIAKYSAMFLPGEVEIHFCYM